MLVGAGRAEIRLSTSSVWRGQNTNWPTGIAWADIDQNGWHDLVVSNGLDVVTAPNFVYFNNGTLSTSPGWVSGDTDCFDNILVADLDNDGDLDIVVAKLGNTNRGLPPVPHVFYLNEGGTLHAEPDWRSQPGNAFSGAMGDPDGDGDIDLVFAQGDHATNHRQKTVMYRNDGGLFDTVPSWQTDSGYFATEAHFVDLDNDGDHDLVIGSQPYGIMVFANSDGMLSTLPTWQSNAVIGGRQMDFGEMNGDGYIDMAVAEGGTGLHLFLNHGGTLDSLPAWSCSRLNEPSAVAWADADDDGDLDLAAGGWFSRVGVFDNAGGTLSDSFAWSVAAGRIQQVAWGDMDNDGLRDTCRFYPGDGRRKLFYIGRKPVQRISTVELNRTPLPLDVYCYDLAEGWVSLAQAPAVDETLAVSFRYSVDLDLAVTGAHAAVFRNEVYGAISEPARPAGPGSRHSPATIKPAADARTSGSVVLFDAAGRRLENITRAGVYFIGGGGRLVRVR